MKSPTNWCSRTERICRTRTTPSAVHRAPGAERLRVHSRRDSCRLATTLKPWGASPTSTFFPPMRSAGCEEWSAITPTIFIPTRRPGPSIATQHNDFKEIYFNGSVSVHHGRQELKAGVESDAIFLHENFSYVIPDCARSHRSAMPYQSGDSSIPDADQLCLYRQPSGSRAVGVCSGCHPARQLDGQRGPALGPLPAAGEPERGESARRHRSLLPFHRRQCSRLL